MTLLYFPRFIHDPEYLYEKISFALNGISFEDFSSAFANVAQPQLVHDFTRTAATPV